MAQTIQQPEPDYMNVDRSSVRIEWDTCRRAEWDRLANRLPFCPFEQSWVYGDAYARRDTETVRRALIFNGDTPIALAQVFFRRVAGVMTLAQVLRGPVLLDPGLFDGAAGPHDLVPIFTTLKDEIHTGSRKVLFWTPEMPDDEASISIMKQCGMRRILTGHGSSQIDLTPDEAMLRRALHGKWRNALVHAEGADLRVDTSSGGFAIPWILERYEALRRRRRFGGPDPIMLAHVLTETATRNILLFRAFQKNEPVAAALFLRHGQAASYLVGWTGDAGRPLNAGTLLLWQGMRELKSRGVSCLDLGGIDTRKASGIARFKLGAGGEPYRLPGTFA